MKHTWIKTVDKVPTDDNPYFSAGFFFTERHIEQTEDMCLASWETIQREPEHYPAWCLDEPDDPSPFTI